MGTTDHDPNEFAAELAGLKRRGCSILVVSPPCEQARCEDLLGDDDRGRERIVVDVGGYEVDPDDGRVVIDGGAPAVRSASASTAQFTPDRGDQLRDLDAIAADLANHVSRLADGGLDPGELRVCFGDAETLAARNEGEIEPYLSEASDLVREVSGMGHCHLPITSPIRKTIEPIFDITLEVRSAPDGREQRWLLHDADFDSGWLAIED